MNLSPQAFSLRRGEPIIYENKLTLYPILMSHYEDFLSCKDAITLRQSSLPAKFCGMDYLSALFATDISSIQNSKDYAELFLSALRFLYLSLRIEADIDEIKKNVICINKNGEWKVESICVSQNNNTIYITPREFSAKIRPIIAAQNGLSCAEESETITLIQDYESKNNFSLKEVSLKFNTQDLVASVAYLSHLREYEIYDWTIAEFERRRRAIERDKRYTLYNTAELSGMVKFKNGNPATSWCFDTVDNEAGTKSLSEIGQTFGENKEK